MSSPQCAGIEQLFDTKQATHDLEAYRRKGASRTTRMLIDALVSAGVSGKTLLDIGGGVGVIQHELIDAGVERAVSVEGSSAYIEASRAEAERRGQAGRASYHHGDFVELAEQLGPGDIVTLDKVVCCYDDMERLVSLSAAHAGRLYGLVFPRSSPVSRFAVRAANVFLRHLKRTSYQAFVHDPERIDALLRAAGLHRRYAAKTLVWNVAVYER